jgi:hypothetical protein
VIFAEIHAFDQAYPAADAPLQWGAMAADPQRTLRGALAGIAAAGVWAAQQPLDKRVFGSDYDDVRLLGKLVMRGPAVYPVGLGMHLGNGALFGAVYANLAPALGGPPALRGPLAGLAEHLATWPTVLAIPRLRETGGVWRPGRAFAQATWRHLLFGAVLGELERRLNPPAPAPVDPDAVASNGHGSPEHLVPTAPG